MKISKAVVLIWAINLLVPVLADNSTALACEPMGRIQQSESKVQQGKVLCEGSRVTLSKGTFFCYFTQQVQAYTGLTILDNVCKRPPDERLNKCKADPEVGCPQIKSASQATLTILSPMSPMVLTGRPSFEWSPVLRASRYKVILKGEGKVWGKYTTLTTVSLPKNFPELKPKGHYLLTVVAYRENQPIEMDTLNLQRLSSEDIDRTNKDISYIKSLNLPDIETYLDYDTVYNSRNLLGESITHLQKISRLGSNPKILFLLGDRLINSGRYKSGIKIYYQAAELAKKTNDQITYTEIRAKIKAQLN